MTVSQLPWKSHRAIRTIEVRLVECLYWRFGDEGWDEFVVVDGGCGRESF